MLSEKFKNCSVSKRPALVAYVTAGDPDFTSSVKIIDAIAEAGADIIELGVPFSDPLADGEANQLAAERAIGSGITSLKVLEIASEIRRKRPDLPLVLFTYLNPVAYLESIDFSEFCRRALASGVNAILPLDLPPEESEKMYGNAGTYADIIKSSGLKRASLVTPNTPRERLRKIAQSASAFIYYVSREGVTGESNSFNANFADKIALIREFTDLPVVVGFGISTPEHVRAASRTGVDGVVVGSAIVRKIEAFSKGNMDIGGISGFVGSLRDAIE